jgi:hypothetical protein
MFHIHTHKPSGLLTENRIISKETLIGVFEACSVGSKICTLPIDNSHYNQLLPLKFFRTCTTTEPLAH